MSKVYSIHRAEPRPGVSVKDFEQFLSELAKGSPKMEGWSTTILKGDRGEGKGKYVIIHEFDSVVVRNRYFPVEDGEASADAQPVFDRPDIADRFASMIISTPELPYTDYVAMFS